MAGTCLVAGAASLIWGAGPAAAQEEVHPDLVQTIQTSTYTQPSPDPAGMVYFPAQDRFLISDSEVDETPQFQGFNLFTATRTGTGFGSGSLLPFANKETTGMGLDEATGTLFVSNDDKDRISRVRPGSDGTYGTSDDNVTFFSTSAFGSNDPEGVEYDNATGRVLVCDGADLEVYEVDPVNATFGDANDVVTHFDIGQHGMIDCEGIGFDAQRNTLLAVDPITEAIYELSMDGNLLRKIVLDESVIPTVRAFYSSVTMAPSSDPSDSPTKMNYWVTDRHVDNKQDPNENDGLLYELTVDGAAPDAPPTVTVTQPVDGSTVRGTVSVAASAFDDVGVDRVVFSVDGSEIATDSDGANGWSVAWNTAGVGDGAHSVTARAVDTAGQNSNDSNAVNVDNTAPAVALTAPTAGSNVSGTIPVTASASDNGSVASVQFRVDGNPIGTDSNGADGWSVQWSTASVASGTHNLTAVALDAAGNSAGSAPVQVTVVDPPALVMPVTSGANDADETHVNGVVNRGGNDLELGNTASMATTAALRYTGVSVPRNATITSAHVQFTVDEAGKKATNLTIRAQASDNAPAIATTAFNISSRPRTTASVPWAVPNWPTVGAANANQRTPNIAPVLQQIVNRPGWAPGNSLMLIITGTGRRTAETFESGAAPVLHLEYSAP